MTKPIIILNQPHTEIVNGKVEQCCVWSLTASVEGVTTGEVGAIMSASYTHDDVAEELRRMAVAAINAAQSTYTFDEADCIDWEL